LRRPKGTPIEGFPQRAKKALEKEGSYLGVEMELDFEVFQTGENFPKALVGRAEGVSRSEGPIIPPPWGGGRVVGGTREKEIAVAGYYLGTVTARKNCKKERGWDGFKGPPGGACPVEKAHIGKKRHGTQELLGVG